MNTIKILMDVVVGIVMLPIYIVCFIVASCKCDDYEWEGIGYDD